MRTSSPALSRSPAASALVLALLLGSRPSARAQRDAAATADVDAGARLPVVEVSGEALDERGAAVPFLGVVAVPAGGGGIATSARTGPDGRFRLALPERRHELAVLSARWVLVTVRRPHPRAATLVVREAFPEVDPLDVVRGAKVHVPVPIRPVGAPGIERGGAGGVVVARPSVGLVEGRVLDESGAPLPGVRVLAVDARTNRIAAAAETNRKGEYALVARTGMHRLYAHAPGLRLTGGRRAQGRLDLVLAIDGALEEVVVRSGRRISFDLTDSIHPETVPPPQVRALLKFDYKIDLSVFCPGDLQNVSELPSKREERDGRRKNVSSCGPSAQQACPASVWARQCKLPRFWWLRLIQVAPPNPSSDNRLWWEPHLREMQRADDDAPRAPRP